MLHQKSPKLISAQNLKEKIDNNVDVTVINVLSSEYYDDCHITDSINIPLDRLLEIAAHWDKDKELVVYCAQKSCPKSHEAYELLMNMGFTNVYEYADGIKDWFQKGYNSTGTCKMPYLHETDK